MYNSDMPNRAELPTTKQLIRSTFLALVSAFLLLITVILPAEYAIDPTGVGRVIGLNDMGEIKTQLAKEAAEDQARSQAITVVEKVEQQPSPDVVDSAKLSTDSNDAAEVVWKDKILLSLKPGQGAEVKLVMGKGQVAQFNWSAKGGPVNFDTHGDGKGNSISYEKGRGVSNDQGELIAAFTGNHGWFFRNRTDNTVMVILRTKGDYSQMKRVL
ncbi:transmembrane anchor protein [Vibrio europaeus]|uniref:transmembrane anchor protein n=1 Tax=Vibrio europaeus TaxID=300876 RepID=UPI002340FAAB|nr:transmembrane anchor protein [Vibrio europaeus]MDC5848829.1 transmembrane anchor protein [Vibrio europaeus]